MKKELVIQLEKLGFTPWISNYFILKKHSDIYLVGGYFYYHIAGKYINNKTAYKYLKLKGLCEN